MSAPGPTSTIDAWKDWAIADAKRRGLNQLVPGLEDLAQATRRLRATEWQPAPDAAAEPPSTDETPHGR